MVPRGLGSVPPTPVLHHGEGAEGRAEDVCALGLCWGCRHLWRARAPHSPILRHRAPEGWKGPEPRRPQMCRAGAAGGVGAALVGALGELRQLSFSWF